MVEGLRDAFVENDVIGNYAVGTNPVGAMATYKRRKKAKKSGKKNKHRRRSTRHRRRKHSKRVSRNGIKYTKKGQPYRILANGGARFIKK